MKRSRVQLERNEHRMDGMSSGACRTRHKILLNGLSRRKLLVLDAEGAKPFGFA